MSGFPLRLRAVTLDSFEKRVLREFRTLDASDDQDKREGVFLVCGLRQERQHCSRGGLADLDQSLGSRMYWHTPRKVVVCPRGLQRIPDLR